MCGDVFVFVYAYVGVSTVLLGKPLGALAKDPNHIVVQFKEASLRLLHSITAVLYSPPWYKIIPTKGLTDFDSALREVNQLGEVILSQRIEELQKAAKEDRVADVGFLGQWLEEGKLGPQEMVRIVSDFLAAGVDTVSAYVYAFPTVYTVRIPVECRAPLEHYVSCDTLI